MNSTSSCLSFVKVSEWKIKIVPRGFLFPPAPPEIRAERRGLSGEGTKMVDLKLNCWMLIFPNVFLINIEQVPYGDQSPSFTREKCHLNWEKPDVDVVPGDCAQNRHLAAFDVKAEVVHLGNSRWENFVFINDENKPSWCLPPLCCRLTVNSFTLSFFGHVKGIFFHHLGKPKHLSLGSQ